MTPLSFLALALTAANTVSSMPHGWGLRGAWNDWVDRWNDGREHNASPTIPLSDADNAGSSPLPSPTTSVQYVLLGVGFQNYSCSATTGTWIQTAPSSGAIATLYDITRNVNANTKDTITRNVLQTFETCLSKTRCTPSVENDYCDRCHDVVAALYRQRVAGEHFFAPINGAQTPNFDVRSQHAFLSAKKAGSIAAPTSAYKGANGLGAVAWLYLTSNGSPLTQKLTSVYRLETAGGTAPSSCSQPDAQLQVPYTAEYWFYN